MLVAIRKVFALFLIRFFWPFFVKYVWPSIVKSINEITSKSFRALFDRLLQVVKSRINERTLGANQKASEAEQQAQSSQTQSEREKHEALARAWREVAEQYREENELLKKQIADVLASQQTNYESDISAMNQHIKDSPPKPIIVIDDKKTTLAALS
jgi:hypothetical protein